MTSARLEDRLYARYWGDGTLDLVCGLALLLTGIAWIFDVVVLGPLAPAILIPLWVPLRRRLVEPRLGHVRFRQRQTDRQRGFLVGTALAGLVTCLLAIGIFFLVRDAEPGGRTAIAALPAALLALLALAGAQMLRLRRFWVYGLLLMAGGAMVLARDLDPGWGFMPAGLVATMVGAILLGRLLRETPEGDDHA